MEDEAELAQKSEAAAEAEASVVQLRQELADERALATGASLEAAASLAAAQAAADDAAQQQEEQHAAQQNALRAVFTSELAKAEQATAASCEAWAAEVEQAQRDAEECSPASIRDTRRNTELAEIRAWLDRYSTA